MSAGLFQNLPGAHEMGSANSLASEPWLLPISDKIVASTPSDDLMEGVRLSARPFRIAANALCAVLALLLTAQMTTNWAGSPSRSPAGQMAEAAPPTIAAEKASLSIHH
ncbi:hypothetical protein [Methylobacterium gnaphalii]|uniref:Uncharacterized protein n=1 Tax=Methylobacterium gnaphalii TaxID=1010610 RepID=A0A512JNB7_9HYPH|nr:hypothetical protein [Methylobacterium gnaphalii]GEP11455.1 hypothetical protein MGN01_33000 [Methylobacterium gnaphalii]GJD71273.1 hypothetical protein MMMDOFMJ_4228 [Methylobacterium gnaphalii]GLS49459.1 hypothetical protein GCM10007885_23080 [Methylobacterium gnaphalii]